jgi:hypothetical protein
MSNQHVYSRLWQTEDPLDRWWHAADEFFEATNNVDIDIIRLRGHPNEKFEESCGHILSIGGVAVPIKSCVPIGWWFEKFPRIISSM